ncbi:MAG TPA: CRISPR-associated primase-polymerase type A1, partial [Myxococcota bacterium]|nr:CRISPR-associated primase-polymerase type A1 [Myxococcota bacterium]
MRAWQLLLRDQPEHPGAWLALAELHEERGDRARATACRKRAGAPQAGPEPQDPRPEVPEDSAEPGDGELLRMLALFAGREDSHARMWKNGDQIGYSPVPGPLTVELLRAHWRGSLTLGLYLPRLDQTVSLFCVDLDASKAALSAVAGDRAATLALQAEIAGEGVRLYRKLQDLGLQPLLEDSGYKGRHLWVFLEEAVPAATVHLFGRQLCALLRPASPRLHLEFFPKQGQVREGGKGNLVKLPLGMHLRSGRRARLLDAEGQPVADAFGLLRVQKRSVLPTLPGGEPVEEEAEAADPSPPSGPAVVPAPGEIPWTEADFEAHPEMAAVLRGCAVLRKLVARTLAERQLEHDGVVVLSHTLGHLPVGPRAVNYLFDKVLDFPASERLVSVLRGSPISCARIRQRLPRIADDVGCACEFANPKPYPTPLLYREEATEAPRPERSLDALLDALVRAEDRKKTLESE